MPYLCSAKFKGVLAQLVERLNGIQKVRSSILLCSTTLSHNLLIFSGLFLLYISHQTPNKSGKSLNIFINTCLLQC